jgi:hypothetical protein
MIPRFIVTKLKGLILILEATSSNSELIMVQEVTIKNHGTEITSFVNATEAPYLMMSMLSLSLS